MSKISLIKAVFISFLTLLAGNTLAADFSKKELKSISKAMSEYNKGKIFQSTDRVAIVGPSINFRLAAKQTEDSSWKSRNWVKFSAIAQLEGISDDVMQDITNEYAKMVEQRLQTLKVSAIPLLEAEKATSWGKLVEESKTSGWENTKKNWGVAKMFSPEGQNIVTYNHVAPFGAHRKLPKELDGILYNSHVQLDFAKIGVEVSSSRSDYGSHSVIYTEGKSSIVPAVSIAVGTFSVAAAKKGEHNLQLFTEQDAEELGISSELEYAVKTEKCSPCQLGFKTGGFIEDNNIDIVKIHADPQKFKAAALDALGKYLDATIALYTR